MKTKVLVFLLLFVVVCSLFFLLPNRVLFYDLFHPLPCDRIVIDINKEKIGELITAACVAIAIGFFLTTTAVICWWSASK